MSKQNWRFVWGFVAGTFFGGYVLGLLKRVTGV